MYEFGDTTLPPKDVEGISAGGYTEPEESTGAQYEGDDFIPESDLTDDDTDDTVDDDPDDDFEELDEPPGPPQPPESRQTEEIHAFEVPMSAELTPTARAEEADELDELLAGAPELVEKKLYDAAWDYAGSGTTAKTYLMQHTPDGSPAAMRIYNEAHGWGSTGQTGLDRIRVYTAASTYHGGEAAWADVTEAAVTYGELRDFMMGARTHALQVAVAPQTDPGRLAEASALADTLHGNGMRIRVLGTVAAQQAATGDIAAATDTLNKMEQSGATLQQTDEVQVASVGYLVQHSHDAALRTMRSITAPGMRIWAQIKVAGQLDNTEKTGQWQEIDQNLEQNWDYLGIRPRIGVLNDLRDAGQLYIAEKHAFRLLEPGYHDQDTRQLQVDAIIAIAREQGLQDPGKATQTLERLERRVMLRRQQAAGLRNRLPAQEEQDGYLAQITAHRIAMQVPHDPQGALTALRNTTFDYREPDSSMDYQYEAIRIVATAFAEQGDMRQALLLVKRIGWYPLQSGILSRAYTDVATASQAHRAAMGGHSTLSNA